MDNDSLLTHLKNLHPAAFEGWDEYQVNVEAIHRKGVDTMMLIILSNECDDESDIAGIRLHRILTVNMDTEEVRVGREGGTELRDEVGKILYPKVFNDED